MFHFKNLTKYLLIALLVITAVYFTSAISTSNLGNVNATGNMTVHGGLLVQSTSRTVNMANLTLLSVVNGTTYNLNSTNLVASTVLIYGANGTVALTLLNTGNYTLDSVAGTVLLQSTYWNGGNLTADYDRYSFINLTSNNAHIEGNLTVNNKLDVINNITAIWYNGGINWTSIDLYPSACPAGSYQTQLGDSITCTVLSNVTVNLTSQDVLPAANNSFSSGSSTLKWFKGWFTNLDVSEKLSAGNVTINTQTGGSSVLACFSAAGELYRGNTTGCP